MIWFLAIITYNLVTPSSTFIFSKWFQTTDFFLPLLVPVLLTLLARWNWGQFSISSFSLSSNSNLLGGINIISLGGSRTISLCNNWCLDRKCISGGFHYLKKSNINITKLEQQEQLIIIIITTQTRKKK